MAVLGRADWLKLLLRSFLLQGSWNYRTLQGAGLAFALLPVLTRLHEADRDRLTDSLKRHTSFFNAHPYLGTIALAALARMEQAGAAREELERFKGAIVSPLGSLGDRLVWARWRPLCALVAFGIYLVGGPWWLVVLVFLVLYNGLHLALRVWGLRLGWRHGREVGRALMASPLRRAPDRLTIPLAVVFGALVPLVALSVVGGISRAGPLPIIVIAISLAFAAAWRPVAAGRLAIVGLLAGSLFVTLLGNGLW